MPHAFSDVRSTRGMIALITVIYIGALLLAAGITTAFIGQTQIVLAGDTDREHATRMVDSACVEEALHRLKLNSGYTGGTVPVGSDTCTVVVSGSAGTRTIAATAVSGAYTKSVTVTATLKQNTAGNARGWSITAWTENGPP